VCERCAGSTSPVSKDFSSQSQWCVLLVRAPGWSSCFAVYEQLRVQKFTGIYNAMALCESSALGTGLADLLIEIQELLQPEVKGHSCEMKVVGEP